MSYVELISSKKINKMLDDEVNLFNSIDNIPTIYEGGYIVNRKIHNYLNSQTSILSQKVFRPLICKIFDDLETLYPSAGDMFLDLSMSILSEKKHIFLEQFVNENKFNIIKDSFESLEEQIRINSQHTDRQAVEYFIEEEISKENRIFIRKLMKLTEITSEVYIEEHSFQETVVRKTDEIAFKLEFDSDFLLGRSWESSDYNFIIIDGFIDSVGEIYHLLVKANETQEPFVIFCKGMRNEVKDVIMQNLKRGTINLIPISLAINELNVNILADIAKCHNGEVVNSLVGDTISAAVIRKLSKGKKIKVKNGSFVIDPVASDIEINNHINYLRMRRSNSNSHLNKENMNTPMNTSLLDTRIKMMTSNKIIIKIGTFHLKDMKFLNDMKKYLDFIKASMKGVLYLNKCKNNDINLSKCKIIPTFVAIQVIKSAVSFLEIIYNAKAAVIIE